jgi:acyl carrier protein
MLTSEELLAYLRDELMVDTSGVEDDTPLFSSGLIDSFALVSLITFLENRCGFRMNPLDVELGNVDSVAKILTFLERVKAT